TSLHRGHRPPRVRRGRAWPGRHLRGSPRHRRELGREARDGLGRSRGRVIELHFHHDLYDGFAIDEAAKVYGPYAAMELVREPEAYVVRLTATAEGVDERTLAAELGNYALGLSVEREGAQDEVAP